MPSPLATSLAATLLALWGAGSSLATVAQSNPQSPPPAVCPTDFVLIIARPEASDIYLPCKVRISAVEILQRNPELIRANREERAYDPSAAIKLAWRSVNLADQHAARRERHEYLSAAPVSTGAALLALSSLLLLCRRRLLDNNSPA